MHSGAIIDPSDVIAAFERMALAEGEELRIDDAIAGLASLMADEQMPEEVWLALLTYEARTFPH